MKAPVIKSIDYQDTWPIRHQVMWPDRLLDYIKLPNDASGQHFGLFIDDQLVSVVSLFVENKDAQFRKFATLAEYQGQGLGTQLLRHVFDEASISGVRRIWCNARIEKPYFYKRFGMQETDKKFMKGGRDYVIMERHFC